jgi:hypothetical protein
MILVTWESGSILMQCHRLDSGILRQRLFLEVILSACDGICVVFASLSVDPYRVG